MQPAAKQPRRGAILALALLAACAYAAFARGAVRIPDESWLQIGLDVTALAAAAAWLSRREGPQTTGAGWLGIALLTAFGAWCAVTMLWSVAPDDSWLEANRALAYALAVLLAVGLGTVSAPAIDRIAVGWLLVASAVALYALAGKVAPGAIAPDEPIARLRAPLQYWNALALVCAMALPVALRVATDTARDPRPRLAALAGTYALVLTLGLTYSRGGFVALAVALVVHDGARPPATARPRCAGAGGVATAPVLGVAFSLDRPDRQQRDARARIHDGRIFGAVTLIMLGLLLGRREPGAALRAPPAPDALVRAWAWQALAAGLAVAVIGGSDLRRRRSRPRLARVHRRQAGPPVRPGAPGLDELGQPLGVVEGGGRRVLRQAGRRLGRGLVRHRAPALPPGAARRASSRTTSSCSG